VSRSRGVHRQERQRSNRPITLQLCCKKWWRTVHTDLPRIRHVVKAACPLPDISLTVLGRGSAVYACLISIDIAPGYRCCTYQLESQATSSSGFPSSLGDYQQTRNLLWSSWSSWRAPGAPRRSGGAPGALGSPGAVQRLLMDINSAVYLRCQQVRHSQRLERTLEVE
jgi:hypothetical protein